ncbi:MAG: PQQ-like beta-propeller repeat protein [Candidatus Syntrophosphaera sp.]|nr:PQQ-like beta-propeller repeat protein [Candidatus Syntrophosphaera sp.]
MISILSRSSQYPQSLCEFQASKDGRYGWFLCALNEEQNLALEEIQTQIKLEIMNSGVLEISKMEIESWLKSFFADFHWKLHASLRKTDLQEKGVSLFFAVVYDSDIYIVQFGRIFCASTNGKKLEVVGRNWKNFHVQSLEELGLLGLSGEDIKVRTQHIHLAENESLIVLPGGIAGKVFESGTEVKSLLPLIESYSGVQNPLWLVVKNIPQLQKLKKNRMNKLQVTSFVLLLATFLAILYMAFGGRFFDVKLHQAKQDVSQSQMRAMTTEILANVGKVLNSPARSIELNLAWSADLDYPVTAIPAFNQQNIYLVSGSTLLGYDKKTRELAWQTSFEAPILALLSTESGIDLCLANKQAVGLDKEGKEIWRQELAINLSGHSYPHMLEITPNQDKRIDRSITVIPMEKGLSVLDSQNGTVMSELQLNENLSYLSPYDDYAMCFYAVVDNSIICIELKIVN